MEGQGASLEDIGMAKTPERAVNTAPRGALEIANILARLLVDRSNGGIDILAAKDLLDKNVAIVETAVSNVVLQEEVDVEKPLSPSISEPGLPETRDKQLPSIQRLTEPERVVAGEYLVIALLSEDPKNTELVKQLRATYEADAKSATIHPTILGRWRLRPDAKIAEEIARVELVIDGLVRGPNNEEARVGLEGRWELDKDFNIVEREGGEAREKRQGELENQSIKYGGRRISYAEDPVVVTGNYLAKNSPFAEQVTNNLTSLKAALSTKS